MFNRLVDFKGKINFLSFIFISAILLLNSSNIFAANKDAGESYDSIKSLSNIVDKPDLSKLPKNLPSEVYSYIELSKSKNLSRYCVVDCFWASPISLEVLDSNSEKSLHFSFTVKNLSRENKAFELPGSVSNWPKKVLVNSKEVEIIKNNEKPYILLEGLSNSKLDIYYKDEVSKSINLNQNIFALIKGKSNEYELTTSSSYNYDLNKDQSDRNKNAAVLVEEKAVEVEKKAIDLKPKVKISYLVIDDYNPVLTTRLEIFNPGSQSILTFSDIEPSGSLYVSNKTNNASIDNKQLKVNAKNGLTIVELDSYIVDIKNFKIPLIQSSGVSVEPNRFVSIKNSSIHTLEVANSNPIDPKNTNINESWKGYSTYLVASDSSIAINFKDVYVNEQKFKLKQNSIFVRLMLDQDRYTITQNSKAFVPKQASFEQSHEKTLLSNASVNGVPVAVYEDDKKTRYLNLPLGESDFHIFASVDLNPWVMNINRSLVNQFDNEPIPTNVSLYMFDAYKVLFISNEEGRSGLFYAFNLWEIFYCLLVLASFYKLFNYKVALSVLSAIVLGRLYFGTFFFYFGYLAFALAFNNYVKSNDEKLKAYIKKFNQVNLALVLGLFAIVALPFTFKRMYYFLHPSLDIMGQPNVGGNILANEFGIGNLIYSNFFPIMGLLFGVYIVQKIYLAVKQKTATTGKMIVLGLCCIFAFSIGFKIDLLSSGHDTVFGNGPAEMDGSGLTFGASVGRDTNKSIPAAVPAGAPMVMSQENEQAAMDEIRETRKMEVGVSVSMPSPVAKVKEMKKDFKNYAYAQAGIGEYERFSGGYYEFRIKPTQTSATVYLIPPSVSRVLGLVLVLLYMHIMYVWFRKFNKE